jgi:DNA polymerase lambda
MNGAKMHSTSEFFEHVEDLCRQLDEEKDEFPVYNRTKKTIVRNNYKIELRRIKAEMEKSIANAKPIGRVKLHSFSNNENAIIHPQLNINDDEEIETQTRSTKSETQQTSQFSQSSQVSQSASMFQGLHFYFLPGGGLSAARIKLFREKICNKGGNVHDQFDNTVTHIITAQSFSQLLKQMNKFETDLMSDRIHIHTTEWISQSLRDAALCDDYTYIVEKIVSSQSTNSSQTSSQRSKTIEVVTETNSYSDDDIEMDVEPVKPVKTIFRAPNKNYFVCQQSSSENNVNKEITDELESLEKIYLQTGDHWRAMAYRKAIAAIKRYPRKIESAAEVRCIKGVGAKTAEKIEELLSSGTISRLRGLSNSENVQTIQLFCRIWGVGIETAKQWYSQGYRTLDDVSEKAKLNHQQQIGLKYIHDFEQRIPRNEVEEISSIVRDAALSVRPTLECVTCGSYRRGKSDSGDVDVLITDNKNEKPIEGVLARILAKLHAGDTPFLTDDLSSINKIMDDSDSYMGVCKLPRGIYHRRIDIKIYDKETFPFALLYFTGSDHFNRSMRLFAHKMGLSLSDKALSHVIRVSNKKVCEGEKIRCRTERDIFTALNLEYKEPHERNV